VSPGELARQALKAYERALELQRQGNWAGYGEQLKNLEDILRRLAK
jgi:exonuclease VII small subunit